MNNPASSSLSLDIRFLCLFLCIFFPLCSSSPHSIFKHFETLKPHHFSVKEKRSVHTTGFSEITVSFSAFRKRFTMLLKPGSRVIHPQLSVHLVDNKGHAKPFIPHSNNFYTGILNGNPIHEVDASEYDGIWMAHIHTPHEVYAVEPLRLYDSKVGYRDIIVYKSSDIRPSNESEKQPFCEVVLFNESSEDQLKKREVVNHPTTSQNNGSHVYINRDLKGSKASARGKAESHFTGTLKNNAREKLVRRTYDLKHNFGLFRARGRRSTWMRHNQFGKRATECDLIVVTDYNLYKGIGLENPAGILQTLNQVYNFVDRVLRSTDFGGSIKSGYGVVVRGVIIHTNYSDDKTHYNNNDLGMSFPEVLKLFAKNILFLEYCLAHFTVQRPVQGSTLGVATVASINASWANGICGGVYETSAGNIGMSTVFDTAGNVQSLQVYAIVVAHEISHNWGSNHDDTSDKICSPDSKAGGKYLMWSYSGLNKDPNAVRLSPCSIKRIGSVLKIRADKCFLGQDFTKNICGNGIVDEAEDCDPGFTSLTTDRCCDSNCRLRPWAKCSYHNEPCCTDRCAIAPVTKKCLPRGGLRPCYEPSFCLGNDSMHCPSPSLVPNRTPCGDGGWCWYGRCMSYCERTGRAEDPPRDLRPCECDSDVTSMCRQCCMDKFDDGGKCQVMGGTLKDGTTCIKGLCYGGICTNGDKAASMDTSEDMSINSNSKTPAAKRITGFRLSRLKDKTATDNASRIAISFFSLICVVGVSFHYSHYNFLYNLV